LSLKRYHPFVIILEMATVLKDNIFILIILFVLNYNSTSTIMKIGRYAIVAYFIYKLIQIIAKWFTHKYKVNEHSFYLYEGIFVKKERTISFKNIQNIQRKTTGLHRILRLTSLYLDTGVGRSEEAITFPGLTIEEAERIEYMLEQSKETVEQTVMDEDSINSEYEVEERVTTHFTPTKKDTIKASFTSLSFLIVFPLLASLYSQLDNFIDIENRAKGMLLPILQSKITVALIILAITFISIAFGFISTYLKYGKYEIRSDEERIYITQGVLNETSFSIIKNNVQAIVIKQSMMKRILRLAEVRLVSVSSQQVTETESEVSTLYPFLPVDRAYDMIQELLPAYKVTESMERLSKQSLIYRLLKPSGMWLIASAILIYNRPLFLGMKHSWWMMIILLLLAILLMRIIDYVQTRYTFDKDRVQIRTGSLQTSLFITNRKKVIEAVVTENILQRYFKLSTVKLATRENPAHYAFLEDISINRANDFFAWYRERVTDVNYDSKTDGRGDYYYE